MIRGEHFADDVRALIGGIPAETHRESEDCLRVVTPPRAERGTVEVCVINPDEQSDAIPAAFRYERPPVLTGLEPRHVSTKGGSVVTLLGADFAKGAAVHIDGRPVPAARPNEGRLEVVVSPHDAGEVSVVVKNPDGQTATLPSPLCFSEPPRLDALTPERDVTAGGAEVVLRGEHFEAGCAVLFAGAPLDEVVFVSPTELRVKAPAHGTVEAVDVAVVNPTGLMHRVAPAFAYTKAPPQIASIAPDRGPSAGGTRLILRGRNLDERCGVFLCGIAAQVVWKGREEVEAVTPAVARDGLVDVRVVNVDDQACTREKAFRYEAALPPPLLAKVSPNRGSQAGGAKVAVLGEDFAEGVKVLFGGVDAAVKFLTHKELSVVVPVSNVAGEVAVEVVNPDGASSALDAAFTYEARPAPVIASVAPLFGPTTGGTRVVIEGKSFSKDCLVYIGREYPKDLAIKSATEIHIVTAPRKTPGVVDVEVAAPGASRAVMKSAFRYDAMPAPTISSVAPNVGGVGGGTEMTITGKNFIKETAVLVGGKAPRTVKLVDATTLELKTPPGEAGKMVDVVVRNPDGKEASQKRAFLYDPRYR